MSCQCQGIADEFNDRVARREFRSYVKRGPRKTTRSLISRVREVATDADSLLDIGGGVGAIQHELQKSGVNRITNVDASPAYLGMARKHGDELALAGERTYLQGDFVQIASSVDAADIVTLDRVLCCYDDVDQLVRQSAAKAKVAYGVVYPTVNWWSRLVFSSMNILMRIRRSCFRGFLHDPDFVEKLLSEAGFSRFSFEKGPLWQVVVYKREN